MADAADNILHAVAKGAVDGLTDAADLRGQKERAYTDRNLLAVAFATYRYPNSGWYLPTEADDDAEWPVVWTATPDGNVSWHVPPAYVDILRLSLLDETEPPGGYSGYDRREKNSRLLTSILRDSATEIDDSTRDELLE